MRFAHILGIYLSFEGDNNNKIIIIITVGFYIALYTVWNTVSKRFTLANYYRCHLHHLSGSRLGALLDDSSYPIFAWVDEAIETKYLAQGYKHVGPSGARTHNLMFMGVMLISLRHTWSQSCPFGFLFSPKK